MSPARAARPWMAGLLAALFACGAPPGEGARPAASAGPTQTAPHGYAAVADSRVVGIPVERRVSTVPSASPPPSAEEAGMAALNRDCLEGKGERCFQLAQILERRATLSDASPSGAISAYGQACRWEYVAGCLRMGEIYATDEYLMKRPEEAMRFFRAACERGAAAGCDAVRRMEVPSGAPPRSPEELTLLTCEGGGVEACLRVGEMYEAGAGRPVDLERAAQLYRKLCRLSGEDVRGCNKASGLFRSTAWPGRDPALAARYSQRACDGIRPDRFNLDKRYAEAALTGCKELARVYESGTGRRERPCPRGRALRQDLQLPRRRGLLRGGAPLPARRRRSQGRGPSERLFQGSLPSRRAAGLRGSRAMSRRTRSKAGARGVRFASS